MRWRSGRGRLGEQIVGRLPQVGGDEPVVFHDDRAFGAGELDAALVAGIGGRCRFERPEGAAVELEQRNDRVLDFDRRGVR